MRKSTALAALAVAVSIAGCGGSAHPASRAAKPRTDQAGSQVTLTCSGLNDAGAVAKVVTDLRKQDHLDAQMGTGLPVRTRNSIAWGAWVSPGAYAGDLNHALAAEENWADDYTPADSHPLGTIEPSWPSDPEQLSNDAGQFNDAGSAISSATPYSASDWVAFRQAVRALRRDCLW